MVLEQRVFVDRKLNYPCVQLHQCRQRDNVQTYRVRGNATEAHVGVLLLMLYLF